MKASGKEDPHRRKKKKTKVSETSGVAKISLDYQELKSLPKRDAKPEDKVVKIIVAKVHESGCVMSYRIESKGPQDEWIVSAIIRAIEEFGRRDIVLKTDGEPAMLALQRAIAAGRPGLTRPENPPSYKPASNGACEKAVQDVSAHVRALKLAPEARLGISLEEDHPIMEWIIVHASFLLTRFSVGHDGMTPIERLTGKPWV